MNMSIFNLCPPAFIYLVFSITQIMLDTFKGLYNTAFFKFIVMTMITLLLNALCQMGLGIVSWIFVFIPFIFMTVIVAMLLYIFGLKDSTGKLESKKYLEYSTSVPYSGSVTTRFNPSHPLQTQSINVLNSLKTPPYYSTSTAYESFSSIN